MTHLDGIHWELCPQCGRQTMIVGNATTGYRWWSHLVDLIEGGVCPQVGMLFQHTRECRLYVDPRTVFYTK